MVDFISDSIKKPKWNKKEQFNYKLPTISSSTKNIPRWIKGWVDDGQKLQSFEIKETIRVDELSIG